MNEAIERYMNCFLHPRSTQISLREENVVSIKSNRLSFEESMGISWIFAFMQAFYSVLIIYLGIEYFRVDSGLSLLQDYQATTIKVFFLILETILFPVGFWFYVKFWSSTIKIFVQIFDLEESVTERGENMVIHAMSSHAFLIFPFFGKFFAQFAQLVYLYHGLRLNLHLNVLQSMAVLVFPLFILFISLALVALSLAMLFAGF